MCRHPPARNQERGPCNTVAGAPDERPAADRLLVVDDWGPEPLNAEQRSDLLEIVDDRGGKGALAAVLELAREGVLAVAQAEYSGIVTMVPGADHALAGTNRGSSIDRGVA